MVIDGPDELEELLAPPGLKEAVIHADQRLKRAQLHIDELSVLTVSGERIASRMESAAASPRVAKEIPDMPLPSTSIMSRLGRHVS